ncbi:MAG: glucose-1-phosphate thymidylyltransferase RfbA [Caldilineaceae bacterium SB0662_bin_9]|uniref:Glucose-1-phosphate thymidylyltransferase n=1 Tax=Caldilineaceae bacterium SB0662_bin_9 TaxID=2605258 RepID=A0A6B1DT13_9CHLR|nr:glucose-1-phosphate thymidylyltransferase RfbA [Caldilineaceae bacterium]MYD89945.1 glucose-1-phosphate thymidylyltransferase RfbA [Caldilineaceae bacterium SB0662_bin_9]
MKGILMAGGHATRLHPITLATSKQLLPVYDKPLIYYPLSMLMLAGLREIAVVCTPDSQPQFEAILGDGRKWGLDIVYVVQAEPRGVAEAFLLCADYIAGDNVCLILGDNFFYGHGLPEVLQEAASLKEGAQVFAYPVANPGDFGVVEFDGTGRVLSLEEKPSRPRSHYAVTGIYFYDSQVSAIARELKPSGRGELEITDVNRTYLERDKLRVTELGRGVAWLDTGTHDSLLEASRLVQMLQQRQGLMVSAPEEIAWRRGFISLAQMKELGQRMAGNAYGRYLVALAEQVARNQPSALSDT